ncbi:hypothetical protein JHK82_028090 [Glycine max]|nr:hypothetical protein JHK86_028214 [Glycine max]KAG5127255.1 hypothetical protein JHK82_028090 [Glycine max]KAG5151869.1 hypothetical protein JHK84_028341 [Glycine max]
MTLAGLKKHWRHVSVLGLCNARLPIHITSQTNMATGIVIQNCDIVPEEALYRARFKVKSYLGRLWKRYSRTVVMESNIGDFIRPEGWSAWDGNQNLGTLYYAEYANVGAGANFTERVNWKGYHCNISVDEAAKFTAEQFLRAGPTGRADWLKATGIPLFPSFISTRP